MSDVELTQTGLSREIAEARASLTKAQEAVVGIDAQIQKKENEIQTASAIGEREITNLERQAQDAQALNRFDEVSEFQERAAARRAEHADRMNQLESQLGALRGERIELVASQSTWEARVKDLQERADELGSRESISKEQVERAAELEKHLARLEQERSEMAQRIEEYAPVVEAQREATTASGSQELSEAYVSQAETYKEEWKRWLVWLVVSAGVALGGGVLVILVTLPSSDASSGEIASRIAIEVLVLGLLVYAVRVTAHQFRVHRHLETVARSKAAALMTFSRLVAGPGEAEVRAAVAVALAQAVFDSSTTGFIDSSQDGVTLVERIAAPVTQRLEG